MGEEKENSKQKKIKIGNVGRGFQNVVSGEFLSKEGVLKNLPFLLFVAFLMVVYIGYGYYVDNTVREIAEQEREGDKLYSDLQSLMELYDRESLRSKVALEVSDMGLYESKDPPRVVWVDSTFYSEK